MTIGDFALLGFGLLAAALALWALWPRPRLRAGPGNNWRQRNPGELQSGKTDPAAEFDSPYWAGADFSGD